jgi:iron complex transport system permease protein
LLLTLVGLVVVLSMTSLSIGRAPLQMWDAVVSLWRGEDDVFVLILTELRVPRVVLGILVGASLGMAGAAMQGLLRNPLAEPGIVGVSGCAALGAVLVFYTGLSSVFPLALPLGGIAGAVVAVLLLYVLAGRRSGILTLILAGIAINAFAGALTSLVLNLSSSPFAFLEIIFWQMGSLADRSLQYVWLCLPLMAAGWLMLLRSAPALDALTLGEETASSLGIHLPRSQILVIGGTALAVGSGVAVSGVIGFVGLVVPHLLRPLVAHQPGRLLPVSALGGAALVLAADIALRLIPTETELKLGVVTALVGAPFFLYLVHKLRREAL